jgi:hypothetical protein
MRECQFFRVPVKYLIFILKSRPAPFDFRRDIANLSLWHRSPDSERARKRAVTRSASKNLQRRRRESSPARGHTITFARICWVAVVSVGAFYTFTAVPYAAFHARFGNCRLASRCRSTLYIDVRLRPAGVGLWFAHRFWQLNE